MPEVAFETTDYAVTMTLVANGLGPAFVPELILPSAPTGVRRGEVSDCGDLDRMISLVHRDPVRSDVVALVLEQLRDRASSDGRIPT